MPRSPVRHATRAPSIANEVRAMLDVSTYVRLLHEAAMTGFLPIYNIHGQPTGTFAPITTTQRMELMQFFVNKIIPDPPREIHTTLNTPESLARAPHNVAEMSTEELLRVMDATPMPALEHSSV